MAYSLTRGEVRKTLKKLRELGVKPPRVGQCVTAVSGDHPSTDYYGNRGRVEVCRYPRSRYIQNDTGYSIITHRREHGLFGRSGRKRRKKPMSAAHLRDIIACKVFGGKACK